MKAVFDRRSPIGLIATQIDVQTGEWATRTATVGSYCDSYFEYLWDAWDLFGDAEAKAMYDACTTAILRRQRVRRGGRRNRSPMSILNAVRS